jgi:hypothetical protein
MTAIAALTIADGQASPANHTFDPVTTDGAKAQWADRSPAVPSGFLTISHEVLGPSGNRTVHQVKAGYMMPVLAEVDGVDTVVRYSSAQVTLNIHPDSTLQERKDLLAYVANSLDLAAWKTSVQNLEPFY